MHKIELPDAPIGGFKKNMEVTRTLFMSIFKETTCSKFVMIYNRVSIKDVEET